MYLCMHMHHDRIKQKLTTYDIHKQKDLADRIESCTQLETRVAAHELTAMKLTLYDIHAQKDLADRIESCTQLETRVQQLKAEVAIKEGELVTLDAARLESQVHPVYMCVYVCMFVQLKADFAIKEGELVTLDAARLESKLHPDIFMYTNRFHSLSLTHSPFVHVCNLHMTNKSTGCQTLVYMHICIHIHIYMCVHVFIHTRIHKYMHTYREPSSLPATIIIS
jgi:hypothetical protein